MIAFHYFQIRLIDGSPALCFRDETQVQNHDLEVPAGACLTFTFEIPVDGAEAELRFRRPTDPPPSRAITWGNAPPEVIVSPPSNPPSSVDASNPIYPDKWIAITVCNPADRAQRQETSFTLNFLAPNSDIPKTLLRIDPTIIEKPYEPDL